MSPNPFCPDPFTRSLASAVGEPSGWALLVPLCVALAAHALAGLALAAPADTAQPRRIILRTGWAVRSSAGMEASGEVLSRPGLDTKAWIPTKVPMTVVGALVEAGQLPDPHVGMNLRSFPGVSYPISENYSNVATPPDSPYRVPWWYRTEFIAPAGARDRIAWLRFDGINHRANIWLNGVRIHDAAASAGPFRIHEIDVTRALVPGAKNALAVEVFAPEPDNLALTFVDWNPTPPDRMMGIFRDVSLAFSGPVSVRHPQVVSRLSPDLLKAELTVKAVVRNASERPASGTLRVRVGVLIAEQEVTLGPGVVREVRFEPKDYPQLVLRKPALWWPHTMGPQRLHTLEVEFSSGGIASDRSVSRFGIREVTSELDARGNLLYRVNGRPLLVRGAGYTPEMLLRSTPERQEAEIRYVKHMGLDTIRLEGKLEDEQFFDVCDREGILIMAGWCCCDRWEKWDQWKEGDLAEATASLRDQILRLRGRASMLTWMNGSDGPPPARVEQAYLAVLKELEFPNPVVSSATDKKAELSGPSGAKMRGPYEWVPPIYWYQDKKLGGPHGFATEIGPGPSPPPVESLVRFLPKDALWPPNETWDYHCGGGPFRNLKVFDAALEARLGKPKGLADYALKAQVMAYESHRAMLESFGERRYEATGVIQWMLNNAWPSMIWHLYDFYLRPGGSYFGARKATEPLHVQYAYDDRSVVVTSFLARELRGLRVTARIFDVAGSVRFERSDRLDLGADATRKVFAVPQVEGLTGAYFLALTLENASGAMASRNVYWLSTTPDVPDWEKSDWYVTPVSAYADLKGLEDLPPVALTMSAERAEGRGAGVEAPRKGESRIAVRLRNPSKAVAFFVRLSVLGGPAGEEALPVLWDDNYVTLVPGESREILVTFPLKALGGKPPVVKVEGWNVAASTRPVTAAVAAPAATAAAPRQVTRP